MTSSARAGRPGAGRRDRMLPGSARAMEQQIRRTLFQSLRWRQSSRVCAALSGCGTWIQRSATARRRAQDSWRRRPSLTTPVLPPAPTRRVVSRPAARNSRPATHSRCIPAGVPVPASPAHRRRRRGSHHLHGDALAVLDAGADRLCALVDATLQPDATCSLLPHPLTSLRSPPAAQLEFMLWMPYNLIAFSHLPLHLRPATSALLSALFTLSIATVA